jgi:Ohr subfamily peroxiredoxin
LSAGRDCGPRRGHDTRKPFTRPIGRTFAAPDPAFDSRPVARAANGHGYAVPEPPGLTKEEVTMITKIQNVLLTGKTHTTASRREGAPRGDDRIDIHLSIPGKTGNEFALAAVPMHPTAEQLFAGAWSACYTAALGAVAKSKKVALPADLAVAIEVDLGMTGQAYFIQARFDVRMPGLALDVAEAIVHAAHSVCPYSKAVHGNIDVATTVVAADALAA